jgi:hypothetical protein
MTDLSGPAPLGPQSCPGMDQWLWHLGGVPRGVSCSIMEVL